MNDSKNICRLCLKFDRKTIGLYNARSVESIRLNKLVQQVCSVKVRISIVYLQIKPSFYQIFFWLSFIIMLLLFFDSLRLTSLFPKVSVIRAEKKFSLRGSLSTLVRSPTKHCVKFIITMQQPMIKMQI